MLSCRVWVWDETWLDPHIHPHPQVRGQERDPECIHPRVLLERCLCPAPLGPGSIWHLDPGDLAAFGPWGRGGAAMAPHNPGKRDGQVGHNCESLWCGHGHAMKLCLPRSIPAQ